MKKVRVLSENSLNDLGKSPSAPGKSHSAFRQKKSECPWTKFDCSRKKVERSQIKFSSAIYIGKSVSAFGKSTLSEVLNQFRFHIVVEGA